MDELMTNLRLTSQAGNLFKLLAAWLTESNSLVCWKGGGGVTSESDVFVNK